MEGLLLKWTNYMSGWQQRWFTLKDGVLSYYRSQEEMNSGCKGSVKLSVCDVIVHTSDPRRFDLILGEQRFYLRALSLADRQRWVVALGSCKAGNPPVEMDDLKLKEMHNQSIVSHQSELRLYHSLIVQQVKDLQQNLKENCVPDIKRVNEITGTLNAACSTFLSTLDELLSLTQSPSFRHPIRVTTVADHNEVVPFSTAPPSPIPVGLANRTNSLCAPHPLVSIPTGGALYSWFPDSPLRLKPPYGDAQAVTSLQKANQRRLNNGTRAYQTFFSLMEFSFEDLQPDFNSILKDSNSRELPGDFLSATDFVHACRSLFGFFEPVISYSRSGSAATHGYTALQQVRADVLGNLDRLELAISTLLDKVKGRSTKSDQDPSTPPANLDETISIGTLIRNDLAQQQTGDVASSYAAILWLSRSLNFVREFLHLLFTLPAPTKEKTGLPTDDSLSVAATEAYSRCLRSFHSWSLRGVAMIVIKSLPTRKRFLSLLMAPDDASRTPSVPCDEMVCDTEIYTQLSKDAKRYSDALGRTLTLIEGLLACLDLERVFTGSETY